MVRHGYAPKAKLITPRTISVLYTPATTLSMRRPEDLILSGGLGITLNMTRINFGDLRTATPRVMVIYVTRTCDMLVIGWESYFKCSSLLEESIGSVTF